MNKGADVLERSVLPEGKVFITAGEENSRAYVIQQGKVCAYVMHNDEKLVVSTFGPGTIIGEMCLMIDAPIPLSYQALETTTVVTVTRQDFQKKLSRADKTIRTILDHAVKKIEKFEKGELDKARDNQVFDASAKQLIGGLLGGLSEDKKRKYEVALLPHINGLLKEIKNIKDKKP